MRKKVAENAWRPEGHGLQTWGWKISPYFDPSFFVAAVVEGEVAADRIHGIQLNG